MKRQYEEDEEENSSGRGEQRIIAKRSKQTHHTDTTPATQSSEAPASALIAKPENPQPQKSPAQQAQQPPQDQQLKSALAILDPIVQMLEMGATAITKIRQAITSLPLSRLSISQLHGIIVFAHITTTSNDSPEFIQFTCKLFMQVKKLHYSTSETFVVFPTFLDECLGTTIQILQMCRYPKIKESQQLIEGCVHAIKHSCALYAQFQKMFIILVMDTLESQNKQESLFNRHLYKYSWMLVIFSIGKS
jgi:hypothetical protein